MEENGRGMEDEECEEEEAEEEEEEEGSSRPDRFPEPQPGVKWICDVTGVRTKESSSSTASSDVIVVWAISHALRGAVAHSGIEIIRTFLTKQAVHKIFRQRTPVLK